MRQMTMEELALPVKGAMRDGPFGSNLKSSHFVDEGIKVIRTQNIKKTGYIDQDVAFITPEKAEELARYEFKPGDLVIAKLGIDPGVAAVIPETCGSGIIPADVVRFRGDSSIIDHHYLARFLNSPKAKQQIKKRSRGSTRTRVNLTALREIVIDVPSLEEQRRIVTILDKVDEIEIAVKIIQNKQGDMIRSAFLKMFGDPNLNPMNWDEYTLESLCIEKGGVKAGPFGSSLKKEMYSETGYKIYGQEQVIGGNHTIGDYYIPEDVYQRLESCKVESGDLLISLVGSIGRTLVIPNVFEPGIINPRLLRIRTKRDLIHPDFLKVFLALPEIQFRLMGSSHGQTMPVLNGRIMKKISIITPPLPLQKKFLESLDNIDKTLQRTDIMAKKSNKLVKSITQELLT